MTTEEKYIARILFKNKVLESDGQKYEDLFIRVMQNHNSNFQPIKPQGSYGDRKNDGFDKITGTYYQVYAPENIKKKEKETITKLVTDFAGLYQYWNEQVTLIKHFFYVVNDKYKGTYPSLHPELRKIELKYKGVIAKPFLSKHLEDTFFKLSYDDIINIVGYLPNTTNISNVKPSVLKEVIDFILNYESPYIAEFIPDDPNFDEKIAFNQLTNASKKLLDSGRMQGYIIEEYFGLNSNFAKDDLRNKFNYLYREAKKKLKIEENKSDHIFFDILQKASPKQTKSIQYAVLVLMAHFFEYCDIFEPLPNHNYS